MKKLTIVVGKTFSGKSTLLRKYLKGGFQIIKTHTTRPVRETENGTEYYFEDNESYQNKKEDGIALAAREYHTVAGLWSYWTELKDIIQYDNPIMILDLEGAKELVKYIADLRKKDSSFILAYEVLYLNTSLDVIRDRIENSDRGNSESKQESYRRLQSDIDAMYKLDQLGLEDGLYDITLPVFYGSV